MALMGETSLVINQRVTSVERNTLVKIRTRILRVALDQKGPATFEIGLGVIRIERNGPVKVCERPIKIQPVRSDVTAIEVGLSDIVIVHRQLRIQFADNLVIRNCAIKITRG